MPRDRISEIYRLLEKTGSATVEELARTFDVSESSIRRDLTLMEEKKMINRYYGGASISNEQMEESSLIVRNMQNIDVKKRLARAASTLIKNGDVIYIDGGSTTTAIVDYIANKNIVIVTQAINVFEKLIDKNAECQVLGGFLKKKTGMLIDRSTIEQMERMKFDIAFIGANSVHPAIGYSASEDMEALLKGAAIKVSHVSYILADSSKFNKLTVPKFADLADVGIITDRLVDNFDYRLIKEVYYLADKRLQKYE